MKTLFHLKTKMRLIIMVNIDDYLGDILTRSQIEIEHQSRFNSVGTQSDSYIIDRNKARFIKAMTILAYADKDKYEEIEVSLIINEMEKEIGYLNKPELNYMLNTVKSFLSFRGEFVN